MCSIGLPSDPGLRPGYPSTAKMALAILLIAKVGRITCRGLSTISTSGFVRAWKWRSAATPSLAGRSAGR